MEYYADMDSNRQVRAIMLRADNATVISAWARAVMVEEIDAFDADKKFPALNVQCGDGVKRASLGDYVLKHDDGTFDVKKPFEFLRGYTQING